MTCKFVHIEPYTEVSGVDDVTGVRCKHEFCWVCLADYEPIRTFGNAGHRVTCMHYLV